MQERRDSSALAMELRLSCTNSLIFILDISFTNLIAKMPAAFPRFHWVNTLLCLPVRSIAALVGLHGPNLEQLDLDGAELTDTSIQALLQCTQLQGLAISFAELLTDTALLCIQVGRMVLQYG